MPTIDRKAIEAITGKLSYRCSRLHGGNVVKDADGWKHYAYRVSIAFKDGDRYNTPYKMGIAYTSPPQVERVLGSLLMDAQSSDQPFKDWAADLGYDSDSIKAHNAYLECVKCGQWLRASLTESQIEQLNEMFQDY